jgi:hypothetical protein
MTVKSIEELLIQADATIEDNTTGAISAADVRTMFKDFLDSIGPGYGVMNLTSLTKALTATMSKLTPWTAVEETTAGFYVASAANGEITRLIASASLVGATDLITVTGSVNGPNNANVTLELYKDNAPTGIKTSVTCTGGGDNFGLNIVGLEYKAGADAVYDVRATSIPNSNCTFSGMQFLTQSQPVRAY